MTPPGRSGWSKHLKQVPGVAASWRGIQRARRRFGDIASAWYRRYVRRDPTEVVKSNTKGAFDHFYADDTFIETDYLRDERRAFYAYVADYCAEQLPDGRARMLDVGCGTGHFLHALQTRAGDRLELAGLDFSTKAIERARSEVPGADLAEADVYAIPWPDDSFDLVTSLETLEHLRKPDAALGEIARLCKPGGSMVLTVPNGENDDWEGHFQFWNPAEFATFVGRFAEVEEVRDLPEFGAMIARARKRVGQQVGEPAVDGARELGC